MRFRIRRHSAFCLSHRWCVREFPLKSSSGGKFTFENKEHDFPQRVIYERKGSESLLAAIEGTFKGKEAREEFQMKKVRCAE